MSEYITIPRENFPSGTVEVVLREPLVADQLEAARRHPSEDERVGYSQKELLCALCVVGVNGAQLTDPRDPLYVMRQLSHADGQYLLSVFLSVFTLDDDLVNQAKAIADAHRYSGGQTCSISKEQMPTGKFSISFKLPVLGDRIDLERRYPGAQSNCGYSFEEMFFCHSLQAIDGQALVKPKDLLDTCRDWSLLDFQFALSTFIKCSSIDYPKMQEAQATGKDLRAQFYKRSSTAGESDTQSTTSSKSSSRASKPAVLSEPMPT